MRAIDYTRVCNVQYVYDGNVANGKMQGLNKMANLLSALRPRSSLY
jgi:hypothetical protein